MGGARKPTVLRIIVLLYTLAIVAGLMLTECGEEGSHPMQSASAVCRPSDSRCRYWAKVIRAEDSVPMPNHVAGANDVPGDYLRRGDDVEIFPGDYLLEGEEVSHRKARGWSYTLQWLASTGLVPVDYAAVKDAIRADARLDPAERKALLLGSGDVAAMIRCIAYRRILAARRAEDAESERAIDGANEAAIVALAIGGAR